MNLWTGPRLNWGFTGYHVIVVAILPLLLTFAVCIVTVATFLKGVKSAKTIHFMKYLINTNGEIRSLYRLKVFFFFFIIILRQKYRDKLQKNNVSEITLFNFSGKIDFTLLLL